MRWKPVALAVGLVALVGLVAAVLVALSWRTTPEAPAPPEAPVATAAPPPKPAANFLPERAAQVAPEQTWTLSELPGTLNPLYAETAADLAAQSLVFDRLFYLSPDSGERRTRVLADWAVSRGDGAVLLTLVEGLSWHDGAPVVAADLCASLELPARVAGSRLEAPALSSCEETGPRSVRVELAEPGGDPRALLDLPLLPAHLASELADPLSELMARPVGSAGYSASRGRRAVRFEARAVPHHQPPVTRLTWSETSDPLVAAKTLEHGAQQAMLGPVPDWLAADLPGMGAFLLTDLGGLGAGAFAEGAWEEVIIDGEGFLLDFDQSTLSD